MDGFDRRKGRWMVLIGGRVDGWNGVVYLFWLTNIIFVLHFLGAWAAHVD